MAEDEAKTESTLAVFKTNGDEIELKVDAEHETIWSTQAQIAKTFDVRRTTITKHIAKLFSDKELPEESNVQKVHIAESKKPVSYYSLDVALAVGYRVNSAKAIRFRQWATQTLRQFMVQGYAINPQVLERNPDALKALAAEIRRIRLSERAQYLKVRDVFKNSASDYDASSPTAERFFAMAQDKFHYAITQKTAAEIVIERADGKRPNMGMTIIEKDQPTLSEAKVAKNYLTEDELQSLENISEQFLLFAEAKAFRRQKMTMEELAFKLNTLLTANDYPVLYEYKQYLGAKRDQHAKEQLEILRKQLNPPKSVKALPSGKKE